jgi:DNA-binding MarR family transcriptional regulator
MQITSINFKLSNFKVYFYIILVLNNANNVKAIKMDFDLLTDIIDHFKLYQLATPIGKKSSIVDFGLWLNEQRYLTDIPKDSTHAEMIGRNEVEVEIGKMVVFINRYAKHLIKKGLQDFPELVNEDFTYLYSLMSCESMTKMQLIEKNIHEKPTGLEVIKRLLKHKIIDEKDDAKDKRSKRVFLTEKGKGIFFQTLEQMNKVSHLITGKLSLAEKQQLFSLLKKLDDFHNPIFLEQKHKTINELSANLENK